jgi:hypothetical protein
VSKAEELVARLEGLPLGTAVDVDQAALRVTLDVIGLVGGEGSRGSQRQDGAGRLQMESPRLPMESPFTLSSSWAYPLRWRKLGGTVGLLGGWDDRLGN